MAFIASRTSVARLQGFHPAPVSFTRRLSVCVRAAEEKAEVVGKAVLVDKIAKDADLTKAQASKAFDSLICAVQDAVAAGQKVTVLGFGTFETRVRKERAGRNPRTGEPIKIPQTSSPAFKASTAFKQKVNGTAAAAKAKPTAPTPAAPKPASPKPATPPPVAAAPRPAPAARLVSAAAKKPISPPLKGKK